MCINKELTRYRANRLVALLFLDVPENYKDLVVNHKDGNKLNNNYTNLEWVTYEYNNYHARINGLNNISESNKKRWENDEFRHRVSKKISETQLANNCNKRENNGRFKYKIIDSNNIQLYRDELPKLLNLAQSTVDKLIRESANGIENKYFKKLGIKVEIQK